MAKQISQQTFDDVVKENMSEFDMSVEDSIQDAVEQFESQGVNLANIVKDTGLYAGGSDGDTASLHPVLNALSMLSVSSEGESANMTAMLIQLQTVCDECNIDLAHRCLAGTHQAFPKLMLLLSRFSHDVPMVKAVLQSLCALLNGQPDLLDEDGSACFMQLLTDYTDNTEVLVLVVRLIRLTCIKHEANRQNFVGKDLIRSLTQLLLSHSHVAELVREVCLALRVLTFDDDIRVPFGKAHEHAKMIVTEGDALKAIMKICEVYADNVSVLGELFLTLGSLAVRDEFCEEVLNLGGVQLILNAFQHNITDKAIVRQALVVLRALAGSDQVKVAVVKEGGVELVTAAMIKHGSNPAIAEGACAVLTALTLRNPAHCHKVIQCQGHEAVVQAMKIHPQEVAVQKQACMALRNLVARTREHNAAILELGTEQLLNMAANTHKECHDEAKAALRDLDCAVQLRELWTGQKGTIQQ